MSWILTRTIAGAEFSAQRRLAEAAPGIPVYVPQYRKRIFPRHVRGTRLATYPLFAGYLFLWTENIGADRLLIRRHSGIWPCVLDGTRYIVVPEADIADLRAREASGEFDAIDPAHPAKIKIGDVVLFAGGRFDGRQGVVAAQLRGRRYQISLGPLVVTAPVDFLRPAP
jgi:transcription antitermination factor NusG